MRFLQFVADLIQQVLFVLLIGSLIIGFLRKP